MIARRERKRGRSQTHNTEGAWIAILAIVCFLFSALALLAGFDDAASMTSETDGWVVDAQQRTGGRGHSCHVDYQYEVNGQMYRVQTYWDGGCGDIRPGSSNAVYYDPRDPENSSLKNPMDWEEIYLGPIVLFGFGVFFAVIGAPPAFEKIRAIRRRR